MPARNHSSDKTAALRRVPRAVRAFMVLPFAAVAVMGFRPDSHSHLQASVTLQAEKSSGSQMLAESTPLKETVAVPVSFSGSATFPQQAESAEEKNYTVDHTNDLLGRIYLRETAREKGRVIAKLKPGEEVWIYDETRQEQPLLLRDQHAVWTAPRFYVYVPGRNISGWVHGAFLQKMNRWATKDIVE